MNFPLTRRCFVAAGTALLLATGPGFADETTEASDDMGPVTHEVLMLNVNPDDPGQRMVFSPRLLVINPGDTVQFVATDRSHNSQAVRDMVPEGAEPWTGRINEEIAVTLDVPGVYGYACQPHYSMGMVGMIIVRGEGMTANAEAARSARHRGHGNRAFEEIWAEVDEQGLLNE